MKFRKKPIVIEATQFDGTNAAAILFWIGSSPAALDAARGGKKLAYLSELGLLRIATLESGDGYHIADPGDWIICGVKGEFYPCKPEIFDATYERADDEAVV